MTKKASFFFTASSLSLFVPVPPRLAFGVVLLLYVNIIVLAVIMIKALIDRVGIDKYKNPLFMLGTLAVTMFLYAFLELWSPITAFTLGFLIYIFPVSLFMNQLVFPEESKPLKQALTEGLKNCGILSLPGLFFFVLRELLAYGTLSFPSGSGLFVFSLFEEAAFFPIFFWETIPGALFLLAFLLVILTVVYRRYGIEEERV